MHKRQCMFDIPDGFLQRLGHDVKVLFDAHVETHRPGINSWANSHLLHVHAWARIKESTAFSQGDYTNCSIAALHAAASGTNMLLK